MNRPSSPKVLNEVPQKWIYEPEAAGFVAHDDGTNDDECDVYEIYLNYKVFKV